MHIKVLGAHNLESCDTRHTCFLIDGILSIDAGSITSSLTVTEQTKIQSILLTHRHLDHTRDLPALGLATWRHPAPIDVYSLPETLQAVHHHLLNDEMYPDLTQELSGLQPKYRFHRVQPWTELKAAGYKVRPVPMPHTAPSVGYVVQSSSGACVAFSGDTGGNLSSFFKDGVPPSVFFVEATFPNRLMDLARLTGHLTPDLLRNELEGLLRVRQGLPKVIVGHISLGEQYEVVEELSEVAKELGVDLVPAYKDMCITV